jgi:hypothetical protein
VMPLVRVPGHAARSHVQRPATRHGGVDRQPRVPAPTCIVIVRPFSGSMTL